MGQKGGAREGAGRKPGQVSEAKKQLSEMAKEHAETALTSLVTIAKDGESEAAKVSASIAILDRAFGRPTQAVHHVDADDMPITVLSDIEVARRVAFIFQRALFEASQRPGDILEGISEPSDQTQPEIVQ